jgi:hypothetical protein
MDDEIGSMRVTDVELEGRWSARLSDGMRCFFGPIEPEVRNNHLRTGSG